MKAKYIKKEMPDLHKTGTNLVYYRMQRNETLEYSEFLERCNSGHRLYAPSLLQGAMMVVCEQLAIELAKGNNVKIGGLGTFHARLGLSKYRPGKKMDSFKEGTKKLNAASLGVTGVGYRADTQLVKAVNRRCELKRGGESRLKEPKYTKEERIERAIRYLRREGFMHVKDYAQLNGLSYTTAYRELNMGLVGSATITSRGSKSARIFFLKPE
jgi:nucleoid DNA-binding protein